MYTLTIYTKSMTPYTYGTYESREEGERCLEHLLMRLDTDHTRSFTFPTKGGRTAIAIDAVEAVVLEEC